MFLADANEAYGAAAALSVALLWAFTAVTFSAASRRIGQVHVNQIRLVQASILLFGACLAAGVFVRMPPGQMILLAASGLVGLALGDAALFIALQTLGARRAALIMALAPGFTAVLAIPALRESLSLIGLAGMTITVVGVAWVVLERGQPGEFEGSSRYGLVMGVLGAAGQAGGLILSKAGLGAAAAGSWLAAVAAYGGSGTVEVSPLYGTFIRVLAGTVLLVAWCAWRGYLRETIRSFRDRKAQWQTFVGTILGPVIGVTLSLAAVLWTKTYIAATLMAMQPILVIPIVRVVYRQKITRRAILGSLVAVAGVALLTLRGQITGLLAF